MHSFASICSCSVRCVGFSQLKGGVLLIDSRAASWETARVFHNRSDHLLRRILCCLRLLFELLLLLGGRRNQFECHLAELAGEAERQLVVLVVHPRAGIHADVQGLVDRQDGRDGVGNLLAGSLFPSTDRTPVPPLAMPGPSYLKSNTIVCLPGLSAGWGFPAESLQPQEVVDEYGFAFEQIETVSAEASPISDDHSLAAALRESLLRQ